MEVAICDSNAIEGASFTCDVMDTYADAYENTTYAVMEKGWPGVHAMFAATMLLALALVWTKTVLVVSPHTLLLAEPTRSSEFHGEKNNQAGTGTCTLALARWHWHVHTPDGVSVHAKF